MQQSNYSAEQEKAIKHQQGPMMVLAGPGSGKTLVITQRIHYLINSYGVSPDKILIITFTKAAATEMHNRFLKLSQDLHTSVQFGTFHAIFFKILKEVYGYQKENIITTAEKRNILCRCIKCYRQEKTDYENDYLDMILEEISKVKNLELDVKSYQSCYMEQEEFYNIFWQYRQTVQHYQKLDFDDMMLQCLELFQKNERIKQYYQKKYQYILIDEFQDISPLQYKIIQLLAFPSNNLFIVGDDDQSIYGFRGADPNIMLTFEKIYPNAKKVFLQTNYRSSGNIVKAASNVIQENKKRFSKKIIAENKVGKEVLVKGYENKTKQYQDLIDILNENMSATMNCAIIMRTGREALEIEKYLKESKIACTLKYSKSNKIKDEIIQDILCYIKFAKGENSRKNFLCIMNKPFRYLSRENLSEKIIFSELLSLYSDNIFIQNILRNFENDFKRIRDLRPFALINYIGKGMKYEEHLCEKYDRTEKKQEALDLFLELKNEAKNFIDHEKWIEFLERDCEEKKQENTLKQSSIHLLTLHGSKGLEFDMVCIPNCNEGMIPHKKAKTIEELEEERRMFYVGMTRAKSELIIQYVAGTKESPAFPSRFLTLIKSKE